MGKLSRRRLLQGGLASLIAAPFYRIAHNTAAAADTGGARRLLVFFTPNGTVHRYWRPTGAGSDFSFGEETVLQSLTPYKDDLILIDGMSFNEGTNHDGGMVAMLTAGGPISIDQYIADGIGDSTPFPSIELGVQTSLWGGQNVTRMCYRDGVFVTPDDDPVNAYNRVFGELTDDLKLNRRKSVLDVSRAEIAALRGRMNANEKAKLSYHLDSLEQLERSLQFDLSCEMPTAPNALDIDDNDNFPELVRQQIDMAVQVLACGVTKVASVQCSHTLGETVFKWIDQSEGHHTLSHMDDANVEGVAGFMACENWYAEQFAYLLERLAEYPDPETGGSMLDTTLVVWPSEIGDGRVHLCEDVPWVFAGSGGGYFKTGQYRTLTSVTHDQIMAAIANAFGVQTETFGTGTEGPITDLS